MPFAAVIALITYHRASVVRRDQTRPASVADEVQCTARRRAQIERVGASCEPEFDDFAVPSSQAGASGAVRDVKKRGPARVDPQSRRIVSRRCVNVQRVRGWGRARESTDETAHLLTPLLACACMREATVDAAAASRLERDGKRTSSNAGGGEQKAAAATQTHPERTGPKGTAQVTPVHTRTPTHCPRRSAGPRAPLPGPPPPSSLNARASFHGFFALHAPRPPALWPRPSHAPESLPFTRSYTRPGSCHGCSCNTPTSTQHTSLFPPV